MKLFTSPTCGPCTMLKKLLIDANRLQDVELVDTSTPDGTMMSREYGVRSVPSLLTASGSLITSARAIKEHLKL